MKIKLSIKKRIYWSFSLLVCLFVFSGAATNITLNNNKKLSTRLSEVVEPSLQALDDFKKIMVESKMYATNWVFLRYKKEDKELLEKLHYSDYTKLKERINQYSLQWVNKSWVDSLNRIYTGFEELLAIEKNIMLSLQDFSDYDDPATKFEAERKVEEEILPRTATLMKSLDTIYNRGLNIRAEENIKLEKSSAKLRIFIIVLAITTIIAAIFLSFYMTKAIIGPVNKISHMINDMGKGVIRKIDRHANGDEIGMMIHSVNNLSDKLQLTAAFAQEVGLRNFDMPFEPLSSEDTLGKALITMRENLKSGETKLEVKNKELERKNRELEEFAYVASHDLQEPLRTISSFVDLLEQQYKGKLDDKADKYLSYITHSSNRMKVFITDLLEYSRIGNEKKSAKIDCNDTIAEVLADLDTLIKETGTQITVGTLPVISGYPTEIKQLFQNLVSNAIKFRKKNISPIINIIAIQRKDNWEFVIADNGIGIDRKHFDRIFVIFQRLHTRNDYQGSGIGLSHCKKIVELHKGKIWLESNPGIGTTFYFTIPQTAA